MPESMDKHKFDTHCHEIVIRIKTSDLKILEAYQLHHGWIEDKQCGDYTDIHFRIFNIDYFARWFISFADIAIIQKPEIVKNAVKKFINTIKV